MINSRALTFSILNRYSFKFCFANSNFDNKIPLNKVNTANCLLDSDSFVTQTTWLKRKLEKC